MANLIQIYKGRFIIALFFAFVWQNSSGEVLETATQDSDSFKYNLIDHKAPGFCAELINKVHELDPSIQIKVVHSNLPLMRIERELEDHRIDIFFCLLKSPAREKYMNFIPVELYKVQHVLVTKKNNPLLIKSYKDLKKYSQNHSVLVQQHSVLATTLKKHNVRFDDGTKDYKAMLKKLLNERGDVLYVQDLAIRKALNQEKLNNEVFISRNSLKVEPHFVAYSSKTSMATIKKVGKVLKNLEKEGFLRSNLKKYSE